MLPREPCGGYAGSPGSMQLRHCTGPAAADSTLLGIPARAHAERDALAALVEMSG